MGDQFPAGLRVLVVDDDRTCLAILKKMLLSCAYNVTTCGMARLALAMLRENRERFDVVLSDVYMPDMDGFKLLELVGLEMDLPVIMMSADGETSLVMKGITHGACDYLLKPIRIKELKNIWQHVIRKRKNFQIKDVDAAEHDKHKQRKCDEVDSSIPSTTTKKRKEVKDDDDDPELDMEDSSALKKPRVVWSVELHQQFVTAVNQLGIDKAVPKRILELMNVQGLTRENVASHLQKYRLYLKRLSVAQQQHQTPVMAMAPEPPFSSVEGLQPHPIITPASSQALAALRSVYLRTLCPPSEPPLSGVESPVFVVRPRSLQPSSQRNMLLGGGHDDGNQLPQSQIVSVGQLRPSQEVLIPSSTVVGTQSNSSSLAEQMIHQHQQVPHYNQKQGGPGGDSYLDYSSFKEPSELTTRSTAIEDSIITLPNRSFSSSILAPGGISVIVSSKPPSLTSLNNGIIKCEATDPLSSWESGTTSSSYGAASQLNWPEQPSSDFLQSSSMAADTLGSEIMQRQEYLGAAICPPRITDQLGMNSFKVKQEHSYDAVAIGGASQFTGAGSHLHDEFGSPGLTYKQEQDSAGFFDNELGLEGYIPPGNLYVK